MKSVVPGTVVTLDSRTSTAAVPLTGAPTVAVTMFEAALDVAAPCWPEDVPRLVMLVPTATAGSRRTQNVRTAAWPAASAPTFALTVPEAPFAGVVAAMTPTLVDGAPTPLPLQAYCMRVLAGSTSAIVTPVIGAAVVLIAVMR